MSLIFSNDYCCHESHLTILLPNRGHTPLPIVRSIVSTQHYYLVYQCMPTVYTSLSNVSKRVLDCESSCHPEQKQKNCKRSCRSSSKCNTYDRSSLVGACGRGRRHDNLYGRVWTIVTSRACKSRAMTKKMFTCRALFLNQSSESLQLFSPTNKQWSPFTSVVFPRSPSLAKMLAVKSRSAL